MSIGYVDYVLLLSIGMMLIAALCTLTVVFVDAGRGVSDRHDMFDYTFIGLKVYGSLMLLATIVGVIYFGG